MIAKTGSHFDIIIITGEYYDDHPLSPVGIIARVLDAKNYSVGIIEKPETKEQFTQLGTPHLCFCVTAGSMDSMLHNYTPMKRKRKHDPHSKVTSMPNRAILFYCNKIKQYFKSSPMVIGGIEASLRRFAHYDYWDNKIRRSILYDSRADILVYGNGEKQILEIANRLKQGRDLRGIKGTCIITREIDETVTLLPSMKEVKDDKKKFALMQKEFSIDKNLAQEYENNYLLQYQYPTYTTCDLDWIYSLPFTRKMHPQSLLKMAKFSVITHRGCIGNCNFCSLSLHQGEKIISRSEENILDEIRSLTKHPDFKGYIDDLGGPTANMYGMDCKLQPACSNHCLTCKNLDKNHDQLLSLLRKARQIPGVKKIFVRSGIRYDLACDNPEYIKEIVDHHISGTLKIAPEHFSRKVTQLMNKDNTSFDEFISYFNTYNKNKKQSLRYYFMIGHPGDSIEEVRLLRDLINKKGLVNINHFQLFTPTPMTNSTCMYWTGLDPLTMEPVETICDYKTKKKLKRILLNNKRKRRN
jgi:uncharacterized radical SAM protein YgiQ